jgi:DNA-binding CsgD family transcriptional regulator
LDRSALDRLSWVILSSNGLEQTTLTRLLERLHFTVAWRGRPDAATLRRLAHRRPNGEATDPAPRDARSLEVQACDGEGLGVVVALGGSEMAAGLHEALFRAIPDRPLILFLREAAGLPEPLRLPPNVVGTLDGECSEDMAERALSLIRMGYGILPRVAVSQDLAPATEAEVRRAPPVADLTPREREVAWWICRGCANKEIARILGVSFNTVNAHAGAIRRKLGARNRTEVAMHLAAGARIGDAQQGPGQSPS